jgi:hypothetical protein
MVVVLRDAILDAILILDAIHDAILSLTDTHVQRNWQATTQ